MQINENEIVFRIKASDSEAFKKLYEFYYEELYRFTWRRTRDQESALDIIQDVFSRLWQNRQSLDVNQSIKSFLYRSVVNSSIDLLRKKSIRQHTSLEFVVEIEDENKPDQFDERQALENALKTLSEKQKEVFVMHHVEGFKNKEIADILKISVKAVEKRMTSALKQLRNYLTMILFLFLWNI